MKDDILQSSAARRSAGSRLTCAQCERMLLDAADEILLPEEQTQFDLHLAGCESCSRAMADAQRGHAWLGMLHGVPPEPPPLLLAKILSRTSGDAAVAIPLRPRHQPILSYAGSANLATGSSFNNRTQAVLAFGAIRSGNWLRRMVQSVSQPRFAMTAAMAFFSIALTMNLTGVSLRDVHASSFTPTNVRHSFWSTNARVFRYYDNLRVVYELESRVREVQRDTEDNTPHAMPARPFALPDPKAKPPGPTPVEPHSSLRPARTPQAAVDRPLQLRFNMLPQSSLTASAATVKRGEGARA